MIYNSVVPYSYGEACAAIEGLFVRRDYVTECELLIQSLTGSNAMLTESGLSAILLLLQTKNIVAGDELMVPAYLCQWVGSGLKRKGYRLVFVDVNNDYNMSANDLSKKITRNTKAVIAAHFYGIPCDLKIIKEILIGSNILLIEDSAQSFGYKPNGRMLGTIGDAGIYSFGWFKPISAMGGGALLTHDQDLINRARLSVNYNFSTKEKLIKSVKALFFLNKWLYHSVVLGAYGYKKKATVENGPKIDRSSPQENFKSMQNVQAAIAIHQLQQNEKFNRRRIENTSLLLKGLHLEGIKVPDNSEQHPLLRLPLYFEGYSAETVKKISNKLFERGIEAPMLYPYLPDVLKIENSSCTNAKKMSDGTLHLPVHPSLTKRDIGTVIKEFNKIFGLIK